MDLEFVKLTAGKTDRFYEDGKHHSETHIRGNKNVSLLKDFEEKTEGTFPST